VVQGVSVDKVNELVIRLP